MNKLSTIRALLGNPESLKQGIPYALLAVLAVAIGVVIPVYATIMGESAGRLLLLPLALLLGIVFMVDKFFLLTVILLTRSAADVFFDTTKVDIGSLSIGLGGLVNIAVLMIVGMLIMESRTKEMLKGLVWWFAFLGVFAAGVFYSPNFSEAVRSLLAMLSYFAVFLVAYFYVQKSGGIRSSVSIVLLSSILPVIYAFYDVAANLGAMSDFRLKSTFTHPNIFAFYLVTVASLLLYALKSSAYQFSAKLKPAIWAYLGLILFLLLLTKTRSAWVACFAIFFMYALMFERRYLIYLCIAPFLALMIPSVQDRILDLNEGNEVVQYAKLNSFAWRQLIWEDGLSWMEPAKYLFGYGTGGFFSNSPLFFSMSGGLRMGAHNVYVQLFFDSGLAGFATYLILLLVVITTILKYKTENKLGSFVLIALVMQYAITSFSDNLLGYLVYNWYFWFLTGAGVHAANKVIIPLASAHEG
tara:strand:+ start:30064 stop:31473 length:1410 start_codon:yes stop_codon:yes gene_type:complete